MVFEKSANSWLITVHILDRLCQRSKHSASRADYHQYVYCENNFEFSKEITGQDPGLFMESLNVESLFINITLEETINVFCDLLFSDDAKFHTISLQLICLGLILKNF